MVITYYIGGEPHYLLPNGESITAKQYEALKAATAKKDEARQPRRTDSPAPSAPEQKPAPTYPDPDAGDYYADLYAMAKAASKERRKW